MTKAEEIFYGNQGFMLPYLFPMRRIIADQSDDVDFPENGRLQDVFKTLLVHQGTEPGVIRFAQVGVIGIEPVDGVFQGASTDIVKNRLPQSEKQRYYSTVENNWTI